MQEVTARTVGPCPVCGWHGYPGEQWSDTPWTLMTGGCTACGAGPEQRAAEWRAEQNEMTTALSCERCGCQLSAAPMRIGAIDFCVPCHDAIMAETEAAMSGPEPRLPTKFERALREANRDSEAIEDETRREFMAAAERAERLKPEPHPKTWPSHDVGPDWEEP